MVEGLHSMVTHSLQKLHGTSQATSFSQLLESVAWRIWHFVSSFHHHRDEFTDQWAANTEHVSKARAAFISGVFLSCCSNFSVISAKGLLLLVSLAIPVFKTIAASLGLRELSHSLHPHQLAAQGTHQKCPSLLGWVTQVRLPRDLNPHIIAVNWELRVSHWLCYSKDLKTWNKCTYKPMNQ